MVRENWLDEQGSILGSCASCQVATEIFGP